MKYPNLQYINATSSIFQARHFQACSGVQTRFSLVPRPSKIGEGEGLVYTVCACALMSPTPRPRLCSSVVCNQGTDGDMNLDKMNTMIKGKIEFCTSHTRMVSVLPNLSLSA